MLGDTNAEVKCWNDVAAFKRDVLSSPWVVTAEEEKRCLEEADTEARLVREEEEKRRKAEMRRRLKEKKRELAEKAGGAEMGARKGKEKLRRKGVEGLDPKNRANYPSIAARRRAAATGEFDALGL